MGKLARPICANRGQEISATPENFLPSGTEETTIGPHAHQLISDWASAAGLSQPLTLLCAALRIRTDTQHALFRDVMEAVAEMAPVLCRWDLNQSGTYGLAALATAWLNRPAMLDGLVPARHRSGASSDAEFRDDIVAGELFSSADALFFLLERPYPFGSDDAAHIHLRAWALIRGVYLAIVGTSADAALAHVCRSLSLAALESSVRTWRDFLLPLGAPADSFEEINSRFLSPADEQVRMWHQTPTKSHQLFLTSARHLAKGISKPLRDTSSEEPEGIPSSLLKWLREGSTQHPERLIFPLQEELDALDGDLSAGVAAARAGKAPRRPAIKVDPQKTIAEQNAHALAVRFQLGAAARFLPWDWHQLVPPELQALECRLQVALADPQNPDAQLLAAIAHLAIIAGLGFDAVAQLPISRSLPKSAEWCVDLVRGYVVRQPPRHAEHLKPTPKQALWLAPAAAELRIPIPEPTARILVAAHQASPRSALLGHLWPRNERTLRAAFLDWLRQDKRLRRIQPSMLGNVLGQRVFEHTHDHVLARLLSSNRSAALPASTVYTAYSDETVAMAYPGLMADPTQPGRLQNVAGSLLELDQDDLLLAGFENVMDQIKNASRQGDWARFHNMVALYWDGALRAATGVRPVNTLWQSTADFDWDLAAVFVDDKSSPVAQSGRLIPLPESLCLAFKQHYVNQHLPWVLQQLGRNHMADKRSPPGLLFSVHEVEGGYTLRSLNNVFRQATRGGIEAPLPVNALRHWLRTGLHRDKEADPEIIDAIFGHGDGATLTHGDYSMRMWKHDADAIRPALCRHFDRLGLLPPPLWQHVPHQSATISPQGFPAWLTDRRHQQQREVRDDDHQAKISIRAFLDRVATSDSLGAAPTALDAAAASTDPKEQPDHDKLLVDLSRLSQSQLDDLSHHLLASDNHMPYATGVLHYESLLAFAEEAWDRFGLRVPLHRRYTVRQIEASPFTSHAPGALRTHQQLRAALDALFASAGERSRLRLSQSLCLAIFDLVLVSRITNVTLLSSVATDDTHWRAVRLKDSFYLEWNPSDSLVSIPRAPVQRFPISVRCAWLLHHAVKGKKRRKTWDQCTQHAAPLGLILAAHQTVPAITESNSLLKMAAQLVDQANAIELPGTVAAFLAGRITPASLPWADWIQARSGKWINTQHAYASLPTEEQPEDGQRLRLAEMPFDAETDIEMSGTTSYVRAEELRTKAARQSSSSAIKAHELVSSVRGLIKGIRHQEDGPKHRTRVADQIAKLIAEHSGEVSSAIQILCLWSIDLLLRPGRSRKLATSSVIRYFGALSPRFTSIGYSVELDRMEDNDIEAFYADVLDGASAQSARDIYDGLRNLHSYASVAAGVVEIDWSNLAISGRVELGSPGFIDEVTYLRLLDRLKSNPGCTDIPIWQLQCFAILGFRFGLRGAEIEGLRRDDLVFGDELLWVIVQNNRQRSLKSKAARRVVPQLFELTAIEREAFKQLQDAQTTEGVDLENPPLFGSNKKPSDPVDGPRIRALINSQLKGLTGQQSSSMHKLRKSFAMSAWILSEAPTVQLHGMQTPLNSARSSLMKTLLGENSERLTRRSSWAVARALGHAHPATTIRSYLHLISDVAAMHIDVATTPSLSITPDLVCTDSFDFPDYVPAVDSASSDAPLVAPTDMLRALLLLGHGRTESQTALRTGLPIEVVDELGYLAGRIYEKLLAADPVRLGKHSDQPRSRRLAAKGILSLLHIKAHARLREGLMKLSSNAGEQLIGLEAIPKEEFVGMIGNRRQISMWRARHFRLTAIVARHLVQTPGRLQLESAQSRARDGRNDAFSPNPIETLAVEAGWLPSVGGVARGERVKVESLCDTMHQSAALPRVLLAKEGVFVERRAALRLAGSNKGDHVCDGPELVVALLCMNSFIRSRDFSPRFKVETSVN